MGRCSGVAPPLSLAVSASEKLRNAEIASGGGGGGGCVVAGAVLVFAMQRRA